MATPVIGFAAMLEQFGPREIVDQSVAAEAAGFSGVMAADHFQPWVPQQGQAAFVWNVMTAIAERTKGDVGPGVTCPSFRFHPAIVAQASATLAAMYPRRMIRPDAPPRMVNGPTASLCGSRPNEEAR